MPKWNAENPPFRFIIEQIIFREVNSVLRWWKKKGNKSTKRLQDRGALKGIVVVVEVEVNYSRGWGEYKIVDRDVPQFVVHLSLLVGSRLITACDNSPPLDYLWAMRCRQWTSPVCYLSLNGFNQFNQSLKCIQLQRSIEHRLRRGGGTEKC